MSSVPNWPQGLPENPTPEELDAFFKRATPEEADVVLRVLVPDYRPLTEEEKRAMMDRVLQEAFQPGVQRLLRRLRGQTEPQGDKD